MIRAVIWRCFAITIFRHALSGPICSLPGRLGGVVPLVRPLNSRSATTPPLIGVFPRGERESQVANLISPSALQSSTTAYKLGNSAKHGDRTLFLCYGR